MKKKHISAYKTTALNPNRITKKKKPERVSAYSTTETNQGGLLEGTGYVAGRLGLGIAGVGEGLGDIVSAGGDLLRGDTETAKYRFLDNRTAEAQQSLTEWYNPGKGMQFAGDVASGVGQSSVFLLDALVPGLGTGLFFSGITGQSVAGAAQQTGDVGWKELGYGVASGAAEAALGKLVGAGGKVAGKLGSSLTRSTGKAIGQRGVTTALTKATGKKLAGMGWNVAKNTLADAAGEFAEEFAAEYIDAGLQRLFGIDPNASTSFGEALRAGAVGLVSGAAMGAPANVYNYNNSVAAGRAIREEGGVDQLLYRAAATVDVLKEQEAQAREKGRTKATVPEDAGLVGKTAAKGKQAVANLGAKITASKTKGYWDKLEKNINAYMGMDEAMRNSDVGDALLGELRGNLFFTNMSYAVEEAEEALQNATDEEITEWLVEVNDKAKKAGKADANYTVEDFRANKDGILSTVAAAFWIDEIRRTANGTKTDETAAESPAEPAQAPKDTTAEEVTAQEKTAATEATEAAEPDPWESVEGIEGFGTQNAQEEALLRAASSQGVPKRTVPAMLKSYREGTDLTPAEFAEAWGDGVMYFGRLGLNESAINKDSPLGRIGENARRASIQEGKTIADEELKRAKEKAEKKKMPARNQADAKRKQEGRGDIIKGKGLIVQDLDSAQYTAYKAAELLAPVLGTDIVIETDLKTDTGKQINGFYSKKTNGIHININAKRNGQSIALYTLGHEAAHYIKAWSPEKFKSLSDFVLNQLGDKAPDLIAAKAEFLRKMPDYKDYTVTQLNDLAVEEVVADSMELVLSDGKILDELARTEKTVWQKIKDFITKIIADIRKYYGDLNQASKTAQVLKETVDSLDEIEQLFYEGVTEAGERTRTAEAGVIVDEASGTAMLSVDDIPKTEQEIDDAVNRLVAKLGVDESRARQWVQNELSLATLILRDDMVEHAHRKADRRLTAIVKNSDYKQGTLDFSNICRKRREYTRMMQRIQQAFPNRRFTAEEFATIRKIMVDEGLEVACGLCYVEDRRQQEGYIAETFQKAVETWRAGNHKTFWDSFNKKWAEYNARQIKAMNILANGDYVPTIADLTTVEGMDELGKDVNKGGHPDILRAWRTFNNARGQGAARLLTNEAEYQRQILKYSKDRVKRINDLGGLRIFSFSDFEEFHLLDIIQAVQDCAAMGIKIQFYTKVPSFALLMKDTKAKGNLSLIPKGDLGYEMRNGKRVLVYDPVEGIDFNDPAFEEVARGNPNIGTILVGINDEHIRTAMEDDFIDYIIPFHTGQTEVVRQIKKIGKWKNYKNEQVDKPWESGSKAKPVNVYTDVIAAAEREGDPIRNERQFVERFLKVCEERGLRPRFSGFLNTDAEGKYVYTKGYYKLLLDFKMFDKNGTYLPQEPVIPEFDADLLHELTEKYVAGEKAKTEAESPAFQRALERVEAEVVGDDEGRMYSIDDTPETPDVSDSAFDEALRRAGLSHLVEDTAETADTETAPPPRKSPERDPEEDRRDRIRAHETLANALMDAAQNEQEYRLVKNYQMKAAELADAEVRKEDLRRKTAEVNREIDTLQSKLKGVDKTKREPWVMTALTDAQKRKGELLDEMDALDEKLRTETDKLLSLASAKQLRKLIRAERSKAAAMERKAKKAEERAERSAEWAKETVKKAREESDEKVYKARREATDYKREVYRTAYAKADEKNQKYRDKLDEMAKQSMERREITIRMREARRVLGYLNTMLYHPTKQKHVPESLQALVDKALRSADPKQFGINRDHIREMSELAGKIRKLESKAGRTTEEQKTLDAMKTKYEKLEADTISVKRQAEALMTAFEQYVTSTADGEQIDKNMLEGLRQTVTEIEEAPLNEMTLESLKAVEKIYTVIYHQVNTANQAFATEKAAKIDEMSTEANTQVKNAKELKFLSPRSREWAALAGIRSFLWKNMKPLTVFEAIGSDKLMEIFRRVLDAEDVWITDILEAKKALDEAKKEFGYNKWNLKERREVTTADGSKVSLTLGEMMSLYAYMFREQAEQHLSAGGFVFAPNAEAIESFKGDKGKYRAHLNDQTTHRMRKEDIVKMSEMLTEEQRAYAKAVQEYLTSLGAKGNEVSRKLYGIDLFKETAYFPIKSSHDYIETQTGKSGDPNIKSRGTFKETVPKAGNPIVLEDFMEVVGNHVNTMATYHAFVLPVEDLTRVWNYTPVNIKRDADGKAILDENGMPVADTEGEAGYNSLKAEITKKYGKEANDYILQLLRDLNGGARRESAASILDKGLTAFKRSATMLSLSTIVQQPTSIIRAMAYVEAKYFTGASFVPWETVKKYAPVAAIKEMGGFDTGTGARTAEYINAKQYDSIKDAAKAAVTPEIYGGDPNVRAEAFGWMTGKADEVSWRYLFGAIVNEQAEKLGKAKNSEEVLKAAGERFAEVVRRTQVYDSTLTRSEYMRSKDGLMKMATAFGAEPTTILSMAAEAIVKLERGDKAFFRKTAGAVAASILVNAVISSIIYAMRDDDEEKNILEKYTESVTSEIIEGFNPLEYLPIARDVMSIFKGYDIERTDMSLISNLYQQIELLTSSKRSPADKIAGVSGAVGAFFGLPITNVYRDAKGIVLTTAGILDPEPVTGRGMGNAVGQGIKSQTGLLGKIFGKERGDSYELYNAYVKGDKAHYNRVAARYKTEADLEYALRRELRENDKRIVEAAEAKHSGDLAVYESIVDQIENEGIFDRNIVIRAVNNEVSELKRSAERGELVPKDETATDEETAESLYKASDLNNALERGDTDDFAAIMAALVEDKVSTGKTEAQAKSSVKSAVTAYWKKQYLSGYQDTETRKRIIAILTETGLYGSRNDVATMCEGWVKNSK